MMIPSRYALVLRVRSHTLWNEEVAYGVGQNERTVKFLVQQRIEMGKNYAREMIKNIGS